MPSQFPTDWLSPGMSIVYTAAVPPMVLTWFPILPLQFIVAGDTVNYYIKLIITIIHGTVNQSYFSCIIYCLLLDDAHRSQFMDMGNYLAEKGTSPERLKKLKTLKSFNWGCRNRSIYSSS